MDAVQLVMRLVSAESKINVQNIRTGKLRDNEMQQVINNLGVLSTAKIFIDDSATLTVLELRAKCRRLQAEHNIDLIMVDYLQLMTSAHSDSREREISMISRSMKQIAKELNIPVVVLSQLNRSLESRSDKRPMLSDLRESGSIEQDADVVMFVTRPEVYGISTYENGSPTEGTAEIIIAKQRNGSIGSIKTAYIKEYARFENLSYSYEYPPDVEGNYLPPPQSF
jgi:replicative DNA helicase